MAINRPAATAPSEERYSTAYTIDPAVAALGLPYCPRPFAFRRMYMPSCKSKHPPSFGANANDYLRSTTLSQFSDYKAPGSVVLANTYPNQYTYYWFESKDVALYTLAQAPVSELHYFYMIEGDTPIYLYLDIDAPLRAFASARQFRDAVLLCCAYLHRFIDALYGMSTVSAGYHAGKWALFSASSERKWSMHCHSRLQFASVLVLRHVITAFVALMEECLQHVDRRLRACFYTSSKEPGGGTPATVCIVDTKVYTERPFRLPYNSKDSAQANFLLPLNPDPRGLRHTIDWGFLHPENALPVLSTDTSFINIALGEPRAGALKSVSAAEIARACACLRKSMNLPQDAPADREVYAAHLLFAHQFDTLGLLADLDDQAAVAELERFCAAHDVCTLHGAAASAEADFASVRGPLQMYANTTTRKLGMIRLLPAQIDAASVLDKSSAIVASLLERANSNCVSPTADAKP